MNPICENELPSLTPCMRRKYMMSQELHTNTLLVFLSLIIKWHLSKKNRSAYHTLYTYKDKCTPEKFQTSALTPISPSSAKSKLFLSLSLSLSLSIFALSHRTTIFSLSLNSKAPQPLPSVAAKATLLNITNFGETSLCLFEKPPKSHLLPIAANPRQWKPFPRFHHLKSQEGFLVCHFLYFSHLICMFFLLVLIFLWWLIWLHNLTL